MSNVGKTEQATTHAYL